MSDDGKNILETIKYLNEFFQQTALLLQTSDKLLGNEGWSCIHYNTCTYESSNGLYTAQKWLPHYLFRFYMKADESTNDLIIVSIILNDLDNNLTNFSQPLIAGYYLKNDNKFGCDEVKKHYGYWWAKDFAWHDNDKTGKIITDKYEEWEKKDKDTYYFVKEWNMFGYPLIDISSEADLKDKVIKKLLSLTPGKK